MIYAIGWVRASMNVDRVREYLLDKHRGIGYFLGSGFGAITPFCSCSSIPLFLGFTNARIPIGITMAFLITSPLINEIAVVLLWGLLGWKLTVIYVVAGMLAGVLGGWFMDSIRAERWLQPFILETIARVPIIKPSAVDSEQQKLSVRQRHDLLAAFMKDTGLFFTPENGYAPTASDYAEALHGCRVFEIGGGVDFDQAAASCLRLLENA